MAKSSAAPATPRWDYILDFPQGEEFTFRDEQGERDPCYVVMPGGASLPLNHHATYGVDIARAEFIVRACNAHQALYEALSAAVEVMGEAGSDEHLKQLTNEELGKLWINTRTQARAALALADAAQGEK